MRAETSAGGIVYQRTPSGRLWLLIQHSYRPHHWGFPKGLVGDVHKNEQIPSAALREVREEGGVEARIITPLTPPTHYTYTWQTDVVSKTVHYFLMEYVSGSPDDHDAEINEARFFPEKEVEDWLSYENDRKQFRLALNAIAALP